MSIIRIALLVALASGVLFAAPDEPKKPVPKFKLGKDTTFVDGPLDKDGYIDYEAALNERLKGKITPETNAVVLLLKCLGPKPEGDDLKPDFYKALGIEPPPAKGEYFVDSDKHFREGPKRLLPKGHSDLEDRLRKWPWKAADAPKFAEWLKVNEKPLAVAVEASLRKEYFHPLISRNKDGTRGMLLDFLMPTVQKCREIAQILAIRAMLKVGNGEIDDAFADVMAVHRLGRLISRGASPIDYLVGIALQAIAHTGETAIFEHGRPTAKQSLAYRDELAKLAPLANIADAIDQYERFTLLDTIQSMPRDGFDEIPGEKDFKGLTPEEFAKVLDYESMMRLGNLWIDKFVKALRKPSRAERSAAKVLGDDIDKLIGQRRDKDIKKLLKGDPEKLRATVSERVGLIYLGLLLPTMQKISDVSDRAEQIHRNGLLAAGLAAHFADHKKYPEKLADLVPKYAAKIPEDVFTGKPLIYKKTDTGYLLYSVGVNGKDDGGQLISEEPRGDDIGVRLPRK